MIPSQGTPSQCYPAVNQPAHVGLRALDFMLKKRSYEITKPKETQSHDIGKPRFLSN